MQRPPRKTTLRYIASQLSIGYGSSSEKNTLRVAVISSLMLVVASGCTTYEGLTYFTPVFVAALLVIGMQGLLFATSWRIAFAIIAGEVGFALLFIYACTMLVSVFFSYASLINIVYTTQERANDRTIAVATLKEDILSRIFTLPSSINIAAADVREIDDWYATFSTAVQSKKEQVAAVIIQLRTDLNNLEEAYAREFYHGGTLINDPITGMPRRTPGGKGPISDSLQLRAKQFSEQTLMPKASESERLAGDAALVIEAADSFKLLKTPEAFTEFKRKCSDMVSRFGFASNLCSFPGIDKVVGENIDYNARLQSLKNICPIGKGRADYKNILDDLRVCIRESFIGQDEKRTLLASLRGFEEEEGSDAHHFRWSINALLRGNPLAIAALVLALSMDALVFFCGVLGARHESFLNISKPKELASMQDYPLEVVLGTSMEPSHTDSRMVTRVKQIISKCVFSPQDAKKGFPAHLCKQSIEELGMQKEVGVLLSMQLATLENDGVLRLRTRFILWMCDMVYRDELSKSTFNDVRDDITDAFNENNEDLL